jgi:hypothetical protein
MRQELEVHNAYQVYEEVQFQYRVSLVFQALFDYLACLSYGLYRVWQDH